MEDTLDKELLKITSALQKDYAGSLPSVGDVGIVKKLILPSPQLNYAFGGGFPLGRISEFYGPESGGKEQPHSAKILTPQGWTTMGEIKIGDEILTPKGTVAKVTGKYPQGEKDIFEITLKDDSKTYAGADHLWLTWKRDLVRNKIRKSGRHYKANGYKIQTTKDLLEKINQQKNKFGRNKHSYFIPLTRPQPFSKKELPIDPYALGLLLGDGCMTQPMTTFSSVDEELVISLSEKLGYKINRVYEEGCNWRILSQGNLRKELETLGLQGRNSYTKFIPEIYKWSSIEDRMNILRGLLDTDGSIGKDPHHSGLEYSTSSMVLAKDVVDIIHSLGGVARIKTKETIYVYEGEKKKGALSYRIHLYLPSELGSPFELSRKKKLYTEKIRRTSFEGQAIKNIEWVRKEEASCIMIDDPDHLYITDDFIVTHNTTLANYIGGQIQRREDSMPNTVLFVDMEHAFDAQYAEIAGLNTSKDFIFVQPLNGEEGFTIVENYVKTGKIGLVVWDSIAATPSAAEMEDEHGKSHFGATAKVFAYGLKKLNPYLARHKTATILLNQVRAQIGGMPSYGPQENTHVGGRAPAFYASTRFRVSKMEDICDKQVAIGNIIKIKNVKNKVGIPKRSAQLDLYYETGFNPDSEYLDFIINLGIVKKGGAWLSNDDWEMKVCGRDKLLEYLRANPDKFAEAKNKVNNAFQSKSVLDEAEAELTPEEITEAGDDE